VERRLFTPFQNLPDRKVRVSTNTLIDEQPICDVDFNTNHLRFNFAFFESGLILYMGGN
jgi:hypothetical protein